MFEQSILAVHPAHRRAGFLASLSVQLLVTAMGILLPLIHTRRLALFQLRSPLNVVLAPPPPIAKPAATQHAAMNRSVVPSRIFVPRFIPSNIPVIVDQQLVAEPPSFNSGVPGGMGSASTANALSTLLKNPGPPPTRVEPKPAIVLDKPIRVSLGVQQAKLIHKVVPLYPPLARQARISGVVLLIGVIGKDGTIRNLQVESGHPLLVKAAMDAVRQWVYLPTLLSGQPVEVICPIEVNFTLN